MNAAGWFIVICYVIGFGMLARWAWSQRGELWSKARDVEKSTWAVSVICIPLAVLFIALLLLMPLALVNGWDFDDSRPDGCYRQTTRWSAATKTNQTDYQSVPCPEER